jgi:hypothetical protein
MVEVGAHPGPGKTAGNERVIRSDSGVAHRLSSSARVLSAADSQVKTKRYVKKRLWRLRNRRCAPIGAANRKWTSRELAAIDSKYYPGIIWRCALLRQAALKLYLLFPVQ